MRSGVTSALLACLAPADSRSASNSRCRPGCLARRPLICRSSCNRYCGRPTSFAVVDMSWRCQSGARRNVRSSYCWKEEEEEDRFERAWSRRRRASARQRVHDLEGSNVDPETMAVTQRSSRRRDNDRRADGCDIDARSTDIVVTCPERSTCTHEARWQLVVRQAKRRY
jgi:hypothetical protein